ncbi:hypothetical protein [Brevundimonas diminuta]|uniref:hypothetical protein n=1 Tax=Brevundimonas diminuta TaxID=293 RepID=UPI003D9A3628
MWRLLRPLRYFALHNREKSLIDLLGTIVLGALILTPFLLVPEASFFREGGFLDRLIGLMSALTGFFVAALVAAATFAHPDLDREMTIGAVRMKNPNGPGWVNLTRRELACAIFGYLAFAALAFSVAASIVVPIATAAPPLPGFVSVELATFLADHRASVRAVGMAIAIAPLAHIMTATGLGIYYLMERLHHRAPVIVSRNEAA